MACGSLLRAQTSNLLQDCAATSGAEEGHRVVICESDEPDQQYSRRVHAFALVEHGGNRGGARDVVPVVATNRDDADSEDDDADDYARTLPLRVLLGRN